MKGKYLTVLITLLFILAAAPAVAADSSAPPLFPEQFYGTVTAADGTLAPVGTVITAQLDGQTFTFTVTEKGKYGGAGTFDGKLLVHSIVEGGEITFHAGSVTSETTDTYDAGKITELNLVFTSFPSDTPVNPVIPPTNTIPYQKINPGNGMFTYTTSDGAIFEINQMTVFGVLYASSHSIGETAEGYGGVFIKSIDGKSNSGLNGWVYSVNGNYGQVTASLCPVSNGDKIVWWYSESSDSKPETSTTRFGFIVDTSIPSTGSPSLPITNKTNTTQVVIPPAEKVIPETKPIENTTGLVVLEKTETVKEVQVPVDILTGKPNASVKVVEGNTKEVKLPFNVTADAVHLILELSVVDCRIPK